MTRLNVDGTLDGTFSVDGKQTIDFGGADVGLATAVDSAGRVLIAGSSDANFAVARLKLDGTLDGTFSVDGKQTIDFGNTLDEGLGVSIDSSNRILIGGFSNQGGTTGHDFAVTRLNVDGTLDGTFSGDGKQTIDFGSTGDIGQGVSVDSADRVLVGGYSYQGRSTGYDFAVARLKVDGTLDGAFSDDGKQTIDFGSTGDFGYGVAIDSVGRILVGGYSSQGVTSYDFAVARLIGGPDVTTPDNLASVINNLPPGTTQVEVSAVPSDINAWLDAVAALPVNTGDIIEILIVLEEGEFGLGRDIVVPEGYTLILDGANVQRVIEGSSPALTLLSGNLVVQNNITFVNTTNTATILVSGGHLTLRDSTVEETTGGDQAAIEVLAGTVDLGTAADLGGNTIVINGAGDLVRNSGPNPLSAIGNTFQVDGTTLTSNFDIEDEIFHALDAGGGGLVTYVPDNVYVTIDEDTPFATDLRPLVADVATSGVTFTVTVATNGSAVLLADNQTAEFTPTLNHNGTAQFTYTATVSGVPVATRNVNFTVNPVNDAPVVDLNGSDGAGIDFAATFTEDGGAVAVVDTDLTVTDVDGGIVGSAISGSGDIFVVNIDGRIVRIDPNTGSQTAVNSGAAISSARGMTIEPSSGDLLVTDAGFDRIVRVNPSTGVETVVSSGGLLAGNPWDVEVDGNGDLIVSNLSGSLIRVDPVSGAQTLITSISSAAGVAIEADGNILVSTFSSPRRIVRVNPTTGAQTLLSSGGFLSLPDDLTLEADGNILVADRSGRVIRVNPASGAQTLLSSGGSLRSTFSVVVAANGDIFTTNFGFDSLVKVDPTSGGQTVVTQGNLLTFPLGATIDVVFSLGRITSATVTITNLLDGASESLSAVTTGTNITASYNSTTGVLSLTGEDTTVNYRTVLRTVTYNNTASNPNAVNRLIEFVANDGIDESAPPAVTTLNVVLVNEPPLAVAGADQSANEGTSVSFDGTGSSDADGDSLTYAWTFGDGGTATGATPTHTYADDGSYTVTLTVGDGQATDTDTLTVAVANVAPVASGLTLSATTINEDGSMTVSGSFTDVGTQDTHTVLIDWGAGETSSAAVVTQGAGSGTFTATHQYKDDNPTGTAADVYTITVTVTDDGGGSGSASTSGSATTSVTVTNVAPHSVAINDAAISTYVFAVGDSRSFTGSFSDAGTLDTHEAVWTFTHAVGLDTVTEIRPGILTQGSGSGTVRNSFSFTDAGVYTVTLTITDDDTGATTSEASMFVVYDPSAGFVTGGGWFISPLGAYVADPSLSGKANFGFVAKYKKGTTTLTGQTEFQFKAGDLNFHSDEYIWLVISGARAQYQGTGTINGSGNYGFKLTAIDGQVSGGGGVDRIRLKIWDKAAGDGIVYDSGLGAGDDADPSMVLGGGKIIIHSKGDALQAAGGAVSGGTAVQSLSYATPQPVVNQAIQSWAHAGADGSQLNALSRIDVHLADLSGSYLGMSSASSNLIWIDIDAAGYGWGSDGMDLLSTVSHELGHQIGLDHDVMGATLSAGIPQLASSSYQMGLYADDGPGCVGPLGMSSRFGGYFSLSGDWGLSDPWSFTTRQDRIADLTLRPRSDELDQTDLFQFGQNEVAIDLLFADPDRSPLLDSPYKTPAAGGGDGELDLDLGGMAELRIDAATGELNGYLL